MLSLLLGLAFAQDADLETRLLGPEPAPIESTATELPPATATPAAPPAAAPTLEMPPWWTLPLLGLALGWAYTQRRKTEKVEADAMRVLGRTPLGKDTSVVLLEVRDAHGAWRRLLVGSGAEGPQLITGLGSTHQVPVQPAATPAASFASMMDHAETRLDALPEVPAYPVAPPAPEPPPSMVTSWNRAVEPEPTTPAQRPVLGPAGALAASIHGRIPRGYPTTTAPDVSTEPPPVQSPAEPSRNAQEGLDLLAEVRRAKSRIGTRVQTYG